MTIDIVWSAITYRRGIHVGAWIIDAVVIAVLARPNARDDAAVVDPDGDAGPHHRRELLAGKRDLFSVNRRRAICLKRLPVTAIAVDNYSIIPAAPHFSIRPLRSSLTHDHRLHTGTS